MKALLHVAAVVLFVLAALFAFGIIGHASIGDVLGYLAVALGAWCLASGPWSGSGLDV